MNDKITINGSEYLPIKDASKNVKFTSDYVARLCRTERIKAHRVGKNWYVDENSLQTFAQKENTARVSRHRQLAREYAQSRDTLLKEDTPDVQSTTETLLPKQLTPRHDIHAALREALEKNTAVRDTASQLFAPTERLVGNSFAVVFALCVVAGGWTFCAPPAARALAANFTQHVAAGVGQTLHGDPERSAIALDSAIGKVTTPLMSVAIDVGNEEISGIAQVGTAFTGYSNSLVPAPEQASSPSATSSAPEITILDNNPATVDVGATYNDLGAQIVSPQQDLNLGISASVDGASSTPISEITIDTSQAGTHTIVYTATGQNGLVGQATRTVNVVAPLDDDSSASSTPPTDDASSTDATSTSP